ncbi:MAG: PEGA domain-containing protein, partial [Anaerolineae bacterium]
TALLEVINYCGTPVYFTIADTMYTVEGNGSVSIELPPGEHSYTISKPGFSDIGGTVYVEAGVLYRYPLTCEVT